MDPGVANMIDTYLKNLTKVLGVGAGFATIPLLLSLASLQPPWPPAIGYVSAGLVMISALLAWEWTRAARRSDRRRWIITGLLLSLVGLAVYLVFYSMFVETIPGSDVRLILGYRCTADALLVYQAACPDLPRDALRDAEWEPALLWTRASITVVRLLLTFAWLSFVAGLIISTGAVIAGRQFGLKKAASVKVRRKQS
ncbi:hypothetical protein ASE89_06970 [Sphingomonas sp. Leaf30]|nr:hypothetical protein ASE89_06970 [Sphingomonas sp. Leaf30]